MPSRCSRSDSERVWGGGRVWSSSTRRISSISSTTTPIFAEPKESSTTLSRLRSRSPWLMERISDRSMRGMT